LRRQEAQSAEAVANQASETPDFNLIDTYGRWDIVNGNGQTVQIDLRPNSLPTLDSLQQEHGLSREQAQATLVAIHREFVSRFIMMQLQNRGARANWEQEALAATQWLGQSGIPGDAIGQGLEQMTRVVEQEATAPADTADETDTIGGTEVAAIQFRRAGSGLNLKQLLYHIAETEARQHGFLHRGFRCDSCGTTPIRGTRWKCANCVDLDLCNDCHATCMHNRNHIFYEIRIPTYAMSNLHPVQEVSYPGRLDLSKVPTLPANICKDLVDASDFEKAEIEGLYDQFTCLASSPRPSDPLQFGIDRHTFQQAIVPLSSNSPLRSNLIFDRMFMLFDTDRDGIISFEEFIMGVAFLRSKPGGRSRWKKIFDAYDFDEDGFVSRSDFLRMFRALFTIQKGITQDLLSLSEVENGLRDATSFASTGGVISSAFQQNPRSVPEPRSPLNKSRNEFGDVRDQPGQAVVKEDSTLHINQEEIVGNSWESQAQFPFDHRTGEPLSIREFLYLAPRDQRGQAPSHIARDQKVRFTYDGQSIAEARRVAWQERLQRQRFYTEYEEAAQEQNLETAEIGGYEIPVHVCTRIVASASLSGIMEAFKF
jgi:Ca2+-binding EF-hand superfamily protein